MTGSMQTARSGHVAVLLPNNNQVLVAGGMSTGVAVSSAELYADWRDGFSVAPNPMSAARAMNPSASTYGGAMTAAATTASTISVSSHLSRRRTTAMVHWPAE